jgi:hypothetical protein
VSYWTRVRDPAMWRHVGATRLRFAAVALVTFPLGRWIFGELFPRATVASLVTAILFFVAAIAWALWEVRRRNVERP